MQLEWLRRFAETRSETIDETASMIASVAIESGRTFEELIWHHVHTGWTGGLSVSERQRRAAFKAWETIRAKRKQQEIEDDLAQAEIA